MTREQAHELLNWAHEQNPGPWRDHSLTAARAAETIADACGMEAERAYIMGLLHDIGRYEGVRDLHHVIAGYRLLADRGEPDLARICLTHSFPIPEIGIFSGRLDCEPAEMTFLEQALTNAVYDDYDRLIQLCDSLSLADGISTIEARLIDVSLRHGFNAYTLRKWRAFSS
ncbi:MAG: HD domain-containing protein [Clostridia bacterium]|nr:HD domain-containing protein [Clostridia bacterium]